MNVLLVGIVSICLTGGGPEPMCPHGQVCGNGPPTGAAAVAGGFAPGVAPLGWGGLAGWGWGGFGGCYRHASTVAEGLGHGLADLFRGAAELNLTQSVAAINRAEAWRRQIENRRLWTETYFDMRRINRERRLAERYLSLSPRPGYVGAPGPEGPVAGPGAPVPPNANEYFARFARQAATPPLALFEINQVTGQLAWPVVLSGPEFHDFREPVERLFAARAARGGLTMIEQMQLKNALQACHYGLREAVCQLPPVAYLSGKRFLERLSVEASLAPAVPPVAAVPAPPVGVPEGSRGAGEQGSGEMPDNQTGNQGGKETNKKELTPPPMDARST